MTRTLDQAMGMTPAQRADLRARVDRLADRRCADCYRPLPHSEPEQRACPGGAA